MNMLAFETCQKEQEELGEDNRVDYQANNNLHQQEQDKPDKLVEGGQGELTDPSLPPREARGSTSFPTAGKELAETTQKKGKAKSHTLASSESLDKEAKKGDENNKKKAKLTVPSLEPTKARGSNSFPTVRTELAETSLNQKEARNSSLHGATSAGRQGTQPKLAGGTPAPSNKSTNRRTFGEPAQKEAASKRQWRPIFC